jgi:hypothetical protein
MLTSDTSMDFSFSFIRPYLRIDTHTHKHREKSVQMLETPSQVPEGPRGRDMG